MYLIKFGSGSADDESEKSSKKKPKAKKRRTKDKTEKNSLSLIAASLLLGVTGLSASNTSARDKSQLPNTIKIERITLNRDENLERLIQRSDKKNNKDGPLDYLSNSGGNNRPPMPTPMPKVSDVESAFRNFRGLGSSITLDDVKFKPEQSLDQKLLSQLKRKKSFSALIQRNRGIEFWRAHLPGVDEANEFSVVDSVVIKLGDESLIIPDLDQELLTRFEKLEDSLTRMTEKSLLSELLLIFKAIIVAIIAGEIRTRIIRRKQQPEEEKEFKAQTRFPRFTFGKTTPTDKDFSFSPVYEIAPDRFNLLAGRSTWDPERLVHPSQRIENLKFDVSKGLREILHKIDGLIKEQKNKAPISLESWNSAGVGAYKDELLLFYFHLHNLFFSPKSGLLNIKLFQQELDGLIIRFGKLIK